MQANASSAKESPGPSRRWPLFGQVALVFAGVAFAHFIYVSLYGASLPYWDQWDELDHQILPWFSGKWHFMQLFAPHMEHRVAFTRITSFVLATFNNHVFDNLIEAYANALIYGLLWGVLYALLVRNDANRAQHWLIALAAIALGALPFDWENTLIGFQNAFYFMELAAVVLIGIAAYRALSFGSIVLLALLAIASLFTMAPGLSAAPAAGAAILLCAWRKPDRDIRLPVALVMMALVTILGLALLKSVSAGESLHAEGFVDFARSLLVAMMWPLPSPPFNATRYVFAAILWAPSVVWLCVFFKTRRAETNEIFSASLAGWVLLQCAAIAYSRGHDMFSLPSRYSEITAIGLAANLWLALKLAGRRPPLRWIRFAIGTAAVLVGWVLWHRTPDDLASMRQRHVFTTIETQNVQRYLAGSPLPVLPVNSQDLPYPVAQRLRDLLDNAEMRHLLPPAAFPTTDSTDRQTPLSEAALAIQASVRGWFPKSAWNVETIGSTRPTPSMFHLYNTPITNHPYNAQCALDIIDGLPAANAVPRGYGTVATFGGWAGNGHGGLLKQPLLTLKGSKNSYEASITANVSRPDVAQAMNSAAMAKSGFNLTASLANVAPGKYALYIAEANETSACDLHRTLTVQ
jgi:hypothetical protein